MPPRLHERSPATNTRCCSHGVQATVHLQIVAPAGGTAAGCFRLRHSAGFFGEPIWLLVNSDPSLPPYAGDTSAAAAAQQTQTLEEQQQQQMMMMLQQQQMMAAQQQQQQHGMFGQVQPEAMAATAAGPGGRLFQQAVAGAGIGAQAAPSAGGMPLDEDDMDL